MGYHGGAPSWVYKEQMAHQSASHEGQIRRLEQKIEVLEKEKIELQNRILELEKENNELKQKLHK